MARPAVAKPDLPEIHEQQPVSFRAKEAQRETAFSQDGALHQVCAPLTNRRVFSAQAQQISVQR